MAKNREYSKPSAKKLGNMNDWEKFDVSLDIRVSEKNYRKLNAISAVNNFSFQKIISPRLDEKIMKIDVVNYVENISNEDLKFKTSLFSLRNEIKDVKISSEAKRRLIIFAGVKNCSISDIVEKYVDEIIDEIDLIKLVKEEFI